ncbi:MAG: hypothetical protein PGN34_01025 [Methylobacterium frigidaeris]
MGDLPDVAEVAQAVAEDHQGVLAPLAALGGGDVEGDAGEAQRHAPGIMIAAPLRADPRDRAVRVPQPILLVELARGRDRVPDAVADPVPVVGMDARDEGGQGHPGDRRRGIDAEHLREGGSGMDPVGGNVPVPPAEAARRLEGQGQPLLRDPHRFLCRPQLDDELLGQRQIGPDQARIGPGCGFALRQPGLRLTRVEMGVPQRLAQARVLRRQFLVGG